MATFRQAAVAIAKRHVSSIIKPFNLNSTEFTTHKQWVEFARQSGHTL